MRASSSIIRSLRSVSAVCVVPAAFLLVTTSVAARGPADTTTVPAEAPVDIIRLRLF